MMTETEAIDYLEMRAARHGMTYHDLMEVTPDPVADSPQEAAAFWEVKHISHIEPQATHPHLASDPSNVIPEDPTPNLERGAETMTDDEILIAQLDNYVDAVMIDLTSTTDTSFVFV